MKRFYIAERFSFDIDDNEDKQIANDGLTSVSAINSKYNYFPKTKEELKALVDRLIEERGNEADLNDIYTGYVTDMSGLFANRKHFNGDISGWDVSNVENMNGMFFYCKSFNQDLSRWDVSNIKDMSLLFYCCESFNQDISGWDVSNVENMNGMFFYCQSFNQDLSRWDVSNVKTLPIIMFQLCPLPIEKWPNQIIRDLETM